MRVLALGVALLCASGCATMVHGTSETVRIGSSPPGALVSVNGSKPRPTPFTVRASHNDNYILSASHPGYEDRRMSIPRRSSAAIVGNIFFGLFGLLGFGVDIATGAGSPHQGYCDIRLQPVGSTPAGPWKYSDGRTRR